jgi:hypothetical protein
MGGGKDGKQTGAADAKIRAHVLRKLKEALPKTRDNGQQRKKESAGGDGARECAAREVAIGYRYKGGADGGGNWKEHQRALIRRT